jgi:hypothetical protein
MKQCKLCRKEFNENEHLTEYAEAGGWMAAEIWQDKGDLCPQCLENRAKLAMMYVIDR